jgi:hypothetical protein
MVKSFVINSVHLLLELSVFMVHYHLVVNLF